MQYKKYLLRGVTGLLLSSIVCVLLLNTFSTSRTPIHRTLVRLNTSDVDVNLARQGDAQLQAFRDWITFIEKYGGEDTIYQKDYVADQRALQTAPTDPAYKLALKTLRSHLEALQLSAFQAESSQLRQQLQQKVAYWSQKHTYYDNYDGVTYNLGYEYGPDGADGIIQSDLDAAQSVDDYQQITDYINTNLINFDAMVANFNDKTSYYQPHATDRQLMDYYHVGDQLVVILSLQEQAIRVYQHDHLIKAFYVTTGRPSRPSPPGLWPVENMQSPTVFQSGVPVGSPDYYPDTPINYAMQYHDGGYFLHDSWWRADYGPGTNFPHQDASGDVFSSTGSHGCVNLVPADAAWLYSVVKVGTPTIIY